MRALIQNGLFPENRKSWQGSNIALDGLWQKTSFSGRSTAARDSELHKIFSCNSDQFRSIRYVLST